MSHPEQLAYFEAVAAANPDLIAGGRVLDVGSYDMNGSVRRHFRQAAGYVGVDLAPGPGVDLVGYGHELDHPDARYDVALSSECFEHDPHWRETFANMVRMTRPGGLVAFTCASRGRPEHGTRRTSAAESPGTQAVGLDYYRNLVAADFETLPLGEWFSEWRFWYLPTSFDLYFAGARKGASGAVPPSDERVQDIAAVMPGMHRMVRWPLRRLAGTNMDEARYQRLVLPYWRTVLRIGRAIGQEAR